MRVFRSSGGHDELGATLIEVVAVLALVFTLFSLAVGASMSALNRMRFNAATAMVASKLIDARTQAVKRSAATWLLVNSGNTTVRVQTLVGGVATDVGAAEFVPQQVQFIGFAGARQITFDLLGRPTAAPELLTLTGPDNLAATVTVSDTGRVTVN